MKPTIFFIAFVGIAVGCSKNPVTPPYTNADYVRDHHCVSDGTLMTNDSMVIVLNGKEETFNSGVKPWYAYKCPSGILVNVDYDQPQPAKETR